MDITFILWVVYKMLDKLINKEFLLQKLIVYILLIFIPYFAHTDLSQPQKCNSKDLINQIKCSNSSHSALELKFAADSIDCHTFIESELCQKAFKKYSFLGKQKNNCEPLNGNCNFPFIENWDEAFKSCQSGASQASQTIFQDAKSFIAKLQKNFEEFHGDLKSLLNEIDFHNYFETYQCLKEPTHCAIPQLQKKLEGLPDNIKKELSETLATLSEFRCFLPSAQMELLCYQGSQEVISKGSYVLPGKWFKKLGDTLQMSSSDASTDATSVPKKLKGMEKLKSRLESGQVVSTLEYTDTLSVKRFRAKLRRANIESSTQYNRGTRNRPVLYIKDSISGKTLGSLDVTYDPSSKILKMGTMKTEKDFRNLGVGESLLESAIQLFPDTQVISVDILEETNLDVLKDELKKGKSLSDSIKATPAYKIRRNLGFEELDQNSIDPDTYGFKVYKKH